MNLINIIYNTIVILFVWFFKMFFENFLEILK